MLQNQTLPSARRMQASLKSMLLLMLSLWNTGEIIRPIWFFLFFSLSIEIVSSFVVPETRHGCIMSYSLLSFYSYRPLIYTLPHKTFSISLYNLFFLVGDCAFLYFFSVIFLVNRSSQNSSKQWYDIGELKFTHQVIVLGICIILINTYKPTLFLLVENLPKKSVASLVGFHVSTSNLAPDIIGWPLKFIGYYSSSHPRIIKAKPGTRIPWPGTGISLFLASLLIKKYIFKFRKNNISSTPLQLNSVLNLQIEMEK